MPFKIKDFKFQHSRFLFTHYTFSKCFINQKRCDMDFNVVPPVVFNFWHELMNYERKRNRNSYLYYVIYEGPQLCSLLGEIRGLKRSQKTICSWAKKLYFSNSISTIPMYQNLLLVISTARIVYSYLQEKSIIFAKETSLYLKQNNLHREYILNLLYP